MGIRPLLGCVGAASLLAHASPSPAQPVLGPRFEMEAPVPGVEAWGDQLRPRVAASPTGTLVLWGVQFSFSSWVPLAEMTRGFEGVLLDADGVAARVARFGEPYGRVGSGWEVAATSTGFVVVYRAAGGLVAQRLDPAGVPLGDPSLLYDPPGIDVQLEDLDCTPDGDCLAVIRISSAAFADRWQTIAFGWDVAASLPEDLALAPWPAGLLAVTHGPGGFLVAYLTDEVPQTPGVGGVVKAQRFDAAGVAAGAPLVLETQPSPADQRILATGTANGYAVLWTRATGPVVWGARLDADGALVTSAELGGGVQMDDGWPAALIGVGDDARIYWVAPSLADQDVEELVFASDGTVTAGQTVGARRIDSAGHDGQHLFVALAHSAYEDGVDVMGGRADGTIALLSTADNSQSGARITGGLDGGGLVSWHDNRVQPTLTLAATIRGSDGCPTAPIEIDDPPAALWFAARGGYLVLTTEGPPRLQRADAAGRRIGAVIDLPLGSLQGTWGDPRGGLVLSGDTALVLVDADAAITVLPALGFLPRALGRLDDGRLVAVADDPPEEPYTCVGDLGDVYPDQVSVRILSAEGALLETAFVAHYDCGSTPSAGMREEGLFLSWQEGGIRYVGLLDRDGTWTGPVAPPPEPSGERVRVGDELWWLVRTGDELSIVRTGLDLQLRGVDPLPVDVPLRAAHMVATDRAVTLLGTEVRPPPDSNLRLVGYRLDGAGCRPSPPASDVDSLEPEPDADPIQPPDAGCGCRSGGSDAGGLLLLLLVVMTTLLPACNAARRPYGRPHGRA